MAWREGSFCFSNSSGYVVIECFYAPVTYGSLAQLHCTDIKMSSFQVYCTFFVGGAAQCVLLYDLVALCLHVYLYMSTTHVLFHVIE